MSYQVLLNRTQCPCCFADMELTGLMDESIWEAMSVQERVNLCLMAGLEGKHGGKSYSGLGKLADEELVLLCDYHCSACGTDWSVIDLLEATQTPHQLENYRIGHR